ncbi:MAG: tetratricopeptide repeat protein, partial [Deltaproteobacteria bacterium]|nr:tetratricopeptide repeat protein [Deltaproteobacteria bacterium]
RNLSILGHDVTVFVNDGHGIFDKVRYADLAQYHQELERSEVDILIAARYYHPFTTPVNAKVGIFWTEDAHDQPFVEPLCRPEIIVGIGRIFTVSQWQTDMLSSRFNIPEEKFYITRNGVMWDHFKDLPAQRNPKKLIYTSTPFRGLDVLLDVFPAIRKRVPDAELDIYSSMAVYQVKSEEDEAMYGDLYKKADQPGVHLKKSVLQSDLARALLSAGIFAYPNHFPETSCIAALEAMAAGLPLVTSHLGALPETVAAGGILIEKDARHEAYQKQFIDEVCNLMNDPIRWKTLSKAGRDWIYRHNRWDLIAGEWTEEFERLIHHRQQTAEMTHHHGKTNNGLFNEVASPGCLSPHEELCKETESVPPSCAGHTLSPRQAVPENKSHDPEDQHQKAAQLIMNNESGEAAKILLDLIEGCPEHALAQNDLGVLYYQKGHKEEALEHFVKASELDPDNINAQKNLADVHVDLGHFQEAIEIYEKIMRTHPEDTDVLLALGNLLEMFGQQDDAAFMYERASTIKTANRASVAE